ncbi:MAG: putative metal-dependent hydrolase [Arenicella sp.]|jgi:predicted metal-dependent hydrolase
MSQNHEQQVDRPNIHKRRVKVDFTTGVPRYWLGGDILKTRILDSFSIQFPSIERWHINNVKQSMRYIDDEQLKSEVKDFIFQEGQHAALHEDYNNFIKDQGVDIESHLNMNSAALDWIDKNLSLKMRVALSAGIEHYTALIAENLFENNILDSANEKMRAAWEWHAYEEMEHRAVLFDVYEKGVKGGYFRRIFIYLIAIIFIYKNAMGHLYKLIEVDGYSPTWRTRLKIWKIMLGPKGFTRVSVKNFLSYLKPSFNPINIPQLTVTKTWFDGYQKNDDIFEASHAVRSET